MDKRTHAAKLKSRVAELDAKRRETEGKLTTERARLDAASTKRAALVAELAGADTARTGWVESELDKFDAAITSHKRFVESHGAALQKTTDEIATAHAELAQI